MPQTCRWAVQRSPGRPYSSSVYDAPGGQEDSHNEGWYKDIRELDIDREVLTGRHQRPGLDMAESMISHGRCDWPSEAGCLVPGMTVLPRDDHSYFSPQLYDLPPPLPESLADTSSCFSVNKCLDIHGNNENFVESSTSPEWLLGCGSTQNATNKSNEHLYSYEHSDFGYDQLYSNFTDFRENNQSFIDFRNSFSSEKFQRNISNGFSSPEHCPTRLTDLMPENCPPHAPVLHTPDIGNKHSSRYPASALLSPAYRFQYDPRGHWGRRLRPVSLAPEGGGRPFNPTSSQVPLWEDRTSGDTHYKRRTQDPNTQETSYPHGGLRTRGDGQVQCDARGYSLGGVYTNSCLSPELFTSQDSGDPGAAEVTGAHGSSQACGGGGHPVPGPGSVDGAGPQARRPRHGSHHNGPGYNNTREPPHAAPHTRFSPKISLTRTEVNIFSDRLNVIIMILITAIMNNLLIYS